MRILAAIHPPTTTQAILNSLGLPGPRTADRPGAAGLTGLDAGRTVRDARLLWQSRKPPRCLTARAPARARSAPVRARAGVRLEIPVAWRPLGLELDEVV